MIWLSFFLLIVGVSFGRMGPSFTRTKFSIPVILIALSLLYFNNLEIYDIESELADSINNFMPWFLVALIGFYFTLSGVPIYWKIRMPQLIFGWIIIFVSTYLFIEFTELPDNFLIAAISTSIGVIFSLLLFVMFVRFVESRIPPEDPAPDLTEDEMDFVRRIISTNIGVDQK